MHGYLAGEHFTCERCAAAHPEREPQACEVWTRVMGYFRPVQSFNIGKKGEYHERQMFDESSAAGHGQLRSAFEFDDAGVRTREVVTSEIYA